MSDLDILLQGYKISVVDRERFLYIKAESSSRCLQAEISLENYTNITDKFNFKRLKEIIISRMRSHSDTKAVEITQTGCLKIRFSEKSNSIGLKKLRSQFN